jgi:uncharacterized iron-regulated protein
MNNTHPIRVLSGTLIAAALLAACQAAPLEDPSSHRHESGLLPRPGAQPASADNYLPPSVLDLSAMSTLDAIIPALASKRVVYVGETHDRYDQHLNQLEIIRRLQARNARIAIGMEFFQQPFQPHLDAYVQGRMDEKEFLRRTEYYDRWRFDYRLYQPILAYAREHRIPVIALNVPSEITTKVGRQGLASLTDEEKAQIPRDVDRSNQVYTDRLRIVFEQHPGGDRQFENFLSVQLLWDEGMAERAARFLTENPEYQLVVLAGSGHLEYGQGIPSRVARRIDAPGAIVLQGLREDLNPAMGDYLLLPEEKRLPPAGRLGAYLDTGEEGVTVQSFGEISAAREAGIETGDRILSLDGAPVQHYADVKIALWDKRPGDDVIVEVQRQRVLLGPKDLSFKVSLR